jgi:hypothetical protein
MSTVNPNPEADTGHSEGDTGSAIAKIIGGVSDPMFSGHGQGGVKGGNPVIVFGIGPGPKPH